MLMSAKLGAMFQGGVCNLTGEIHANSKTLGYFTAMYKTQHLTVSMLHSHLIYQALHNPSSLLAQKALINLLFFCYGLLCHGTVINGRGVRTSIHYNQIKRAKFSRSH